MGASTRERWAWLLFLVLAYGITWSVQVPAYLYLVPREVLPTNEGNFLLLGEVFSGRLEAGVALAVLLLCFSFGPSVAGVVVTAWVAGRPGLRDLWGRLLRVRIRGSWLAVIVFFPVGLSAAAVGVGAVVGGLVPPSYAFLVPLSLAVPFLLFLVVCTGLAEEVGWRGFALPHLQRTRTAEGTSWVLGVAWGLWHLPSVVFLPLLTGQATAYQALFSLAGLTVGIVGYTIVLTWIYNNTQSLFWIVVLHGYANAWQSYAVLSSGLFMAQVAYGVLPWLLAVWVLKHYDVETLTRRISPASSGRRTVQRRSRT